MPSAVSASSKPIAARTGSARLADVPSGASTINNRTPWERQAAESEPVTETEIDKVPLGLPHGT